MVNQIKNISRNSFNSFFINILNLFIEFFLYSTLARFLGNVEFGKYVFFISLIKFLGLPIMVGYPYFILRQSSYLKAQNRNNNHVLLSKNIYLLFLYISLLIIFILFFKLIYPNFFISEFSIFFIAAVILISSISINSSISAIIRSNGGEIKGQILENLLPNIKFLIFIFLSLLIYKFDNYFMCLFCFGLASISTLIYSIFQAKDIILFSKIKILHSLSQITNEFKNSIIFVLIQIFVLVNYLYPIIILGIFQNPEVVANYKLAVQISSTCGLFLHSINKITQPAFAKSYSLNDFYQIQKLALISNRLVSICSLLISILIFLFYERFIFLFFGNEFLVPNYTFLIILLSPLINSLFGSTTEILIMSGNEKITMRWAGISLIIGFISNILLVPTLGINGVAISTLLATFIRGIVLWKKCFLLLKVRSSFFLNLIFKT